MRNKFRVWDGKKMHYPKPLQSVRIFADGSGYLMDSDDDNTVLASFSHDIRDGRIMWTIGTTDVNGKEVYQGDIVKGLTYKDPYAMRHSKEIIGRVMYDESISTYYVMFKAINGYRTIPNIKSCVVISDVYTCDPITMLPKDEK